MEFGYFDDVDNFRVLQEVAKVLKRGGKFLLDVWNRERFILRLSSGIYPSRSWFEARDYLVLTETSFNLGSSRVCERRAYYKDGKKVAERWFSVRAYSLADLN